MDLKLRQAERILTCLHICAYDEALQYLRQSMLEVDTGLLSIWPQIGEGLHRALLEWSSLQCQAHPLAASSMSTVQANATPANNDLSQLGILCRLTTFAAGDGPQRGRGAERLWRCLDESRAQRYLMGEVLSLWQLGVLYRDQGEYTPAQECLELAISLLEDERSRVPYSEWRVSFFFRLLPLYEELADLTLEAEGYEAALPWIDRGKCRELVDIVAGRVLRPSLSDARLDAIDDRYTNLLTRADNQIERTWRKHLGHSAGGRHVGPSAENDGGADEVLEALEHGEILTLWENWMAEWHELHPQEVILFGQTDLEHRMAKLDLHFDGLQVDQLSQSICRGPLRPQQFETIAARSGAIALSYFVVPRRSSLVIGCSSTDGAIYHSEMGIDPGALREIVFTLNALVAFYIDIREADIPAELQKRLLEAVMGKIDHCRHQLGSILFPTDIVQYLETHRQDYLLLVPHRDLFHAPFEILEVNNVSLSKQYALVRCGSLELLTTIMDQDRASREDVVVHRALIACDVDVSPDAVAEAESIYAMSRQAGYECTVLANRHVAEPDSALAVARPFSAETFLKELSSDSYTLVHFIGHGSFHNKTPMASVLKFGEGDLLSAQRLSRVKLRRQPLFFWGTCQNGSMGIKDLDVLNACETGKVGHVSNEIVGLTRASLEAGASSVIGTNWEVRDKFAAEVGKAFYRHLLLEGDSVAIALRNARRTLATKGYDSSIDLGMYTLFGNPFQKYVPS